MEHGETANVNERAASVVGELSARPPWRIAFSDLGAPVSCDREDVGCA
jgi:hypothetical protein